MANVHLVLQGKGGVGKSFVASMLAQYLRAKGVSPICVDTDPVNATLAGYAGLGFERLPIMRGMEISTGNFDLLMQKIVDAGEGATVIVDSGASTFLPLCAYLHEMAAIEMLAGMGHAITLHSIVAGGHALADTLAGLSSVLHNFGDHCRVVVWLNHHLEPIQYAGKGFAETSVYKKGKEKISAAVDIPVFSQLFNADLVRCMAEKKTFEEFAASPDATVWSRQRITQIQRQLFAAIEAAAIV